MPETAIYQGHTLKQVIEAALLAADEPLTLAQIASLFTDEERPAKDEISHALTALADDCADRGVELKEVASGFRLQVKGDLHPWVSRMWTERPQKYSRAMLETLSLIAYRQPITRGEIESVRGVSLSSNIIRSLQEREWIRIVGHRDVPGKPALFGTTKIFLDYFNLKSLDELPTLSEIKDMDTLEPELEFDAPEDADPENTGGDGDTGPDNDQTAAEGRESEEPAGASDEDILPPPANEMDQDAADDDLEDAFKELDRAIHDSEQIDLDAIKETPAQDAGVDPDSPQADLIAGGSENARVQDPAPDEDTEEKPPGQEDDPRSGTTH